MSHLKRMSLMTLVWGVLLVALTYGSALAADVDCSIFGADGGRCEGTNNDDTIGGTGEEDVIFAFDGEDLVLGFGDDDTIFGGEGDDDANNDAGLFGQVGDDTIYGGPGSDDLYGGDGNDVLRDAEARRDLDTAYGENGNDNINVADGDGRDVVNCGAGNRDRVVYDRGDEISNNCEREIRQ
jgi:hypothetical protein